MEEAATIDGCTRLQTFYKILLPLAAPGLVAAGIFAFTLSWNEFLYALIFITSSQLQTVPVGLAAHIVADILYMLVQRALVQRALVQRALVQGLFAGSVRG